jgi:16S rRNA (cytosine967-C5)-methyltransferase
MDKDAKKLQQLDSEMQRLSIPIVHTDCIDLDSSLDKKQANVFDRILLDAPCSGLGVLRRNPDVKWNSTEASLKRHAKIQRRFLENLAPMVKANGVLVYSVCSIEPEENEAVIDAFLKKHPEFVIDKCLGKLPETILSRIQPATGFKTLPLLKNMDGFYLARLKRIN